MQRCIISFVLAFLAGAVFAQSSTELDAVRQQRLEIARSLVNPKPNLDSNQLRQPLHQSLEANMLNEVDKNYPNLDELAKIRVRKAYSDVVARHADIFSTVQQRLNEASIQKLADKYSVSQLQSFAQSMPDKKFEDMNLLTPEEMAQTTSLVVVSLRSAIERFVSDFMATVLRLHQQGGLSR
jgi:hypothetical protein